MKKILKYIKLNEKAIISTILDVIGVTCLVFGFCGATEGDRIAAVLLNLSFLVAGGSFIVLSMYICPERVKRYLRVPEKAPRIEEHNYSPDFDELYKSLVVYRVDAIIAAIKEEQHETV